MPTDTEPTQNLNGHRTATAEIRVSFGPHEAQSIPLAWAEKLLTIWREQSPSKFGAMLARAGNELDQ